MRAGACEPARRRLRARARARAPPPAPAVDHALLKSLFYIEEMRPHNTQTHKPLARLSAGLKRSRPFNHARDKFCFSAIFKIGKDPVDVAANDIDLRLRLRTHSDFKISLRPRLRGAATSKLQRISVFRLADQHKEPPP